MSSFFGYHSNFERRRIGSYEEIGDIIKALRLLGKKIALVSGTYDLLHIGHMRYLEEGKKQTAKTLGVEADDVVLIVGLDTDEKVRSRKGPHRPVVPEDERLEMLCHVRAVDMVILKPDNAPKWALIKTIYPDVLILSERTKYGENEQQELKSGYCKEIVFLESQATTSTTARIRLMAISESKAEADKNIEEDKKEFKEEIVCYVPVIHKGYLELFRKYPDARINIMGTDIINEFEWLRKDIRSISPEEIRSSLKSMGFPNVRIIDKSNLEKVMASDADVIMPDEDICEEVKNKFEKEVKFEKVFLRWDKKKSTKETEIPADKVVSFSEVEDRMNLAFETSEKSSDWWRHVGAVAFKDGKMILAGYNKHLPNEYAPYINGDARGNFSSGVNIELTTAIHAEPALVGEAAKKGLKLEDAELYITDFPCMPCAKILATAGFKKIYFVNGSYTMMDTYEMLKSFGMEIIRVEQ